MITTENSPRLHPTDYSCLMLLISTFWLPPLRSNNSAVVPFLTDLLAVVHLTNSLLSYYITKRTELCHKPLCEGHIFSSVSCRQWYACLKLPMLGLPLPPRDMIPLMQHNPAVPTHVLHKQFLSLWAHPYTCLWKSEIKWIFTVL